MSVAKKTRVRKVKTDKEKEFAKSLNKARKQLPIYIGNILMYMTIHIHICELLKTC